ncbi:MAG: restriction endonuclease subunit S [Prevotella sp.]|nr:restriction endonuclease subunit S [Prevotella sp.]
MNGQQLKNSILKLAIQGKLVPQDSSDEPASVLLARIREEKQKLVDEKIIKKEKPLAPITDDEKPFVIPESWEWVRLGEVIKLLSGRDLQPNNYSDKVDDGIPYITGASNFNNDDLIVNRWTNNPITISHYGDLLFTCKGTIGTMCFNKIGDIHVARQIMAISSLGVDIRYIRYFLSISLDKLQKKAQSIIPGISRDNILLECFPLPPLAEQHRIVAKIEELLPLVEEYDEAQKKLDKLNDGLPEKLKKSVLQQAIMGRLGTQNDKDEPASELLKRIKDEKAKLIKEKKIKKEKTLAPITDEEKPFDIPESWEWVRLGEITYNNGQKKPNEKFSYIDIGSINNIYQELNIEEKILNANKAPSRARKIVKYGDILYSTVRPYLHNMCIINKDFSEEPIASTGFAVISCTESLFNKFLFNYLRSPAFDEYANHGDNAKGIAYPAISDTKMNLALIPLPPLAEQHRIVEKIEELLTMIERMKLK